MAQWTAEQWGRISAHLDRALELEGPAREGWITDLERQDAEIGRQLRELLEAHNANGAAAFLERSPLSAPRRGAGRRNRRLPIADDRQAIRILSRIVAARARRDGQRLAG